MHAVEGQSLAHNEGNVLTTVCTTDCLVATILIPCKYRVPKCNTSGNQ